MSTRWNTWHLHLDTPAVTAADRVLLRVIEPVVTQWNRPWFFLRYWQGGPHLRLRIADLTEDEAARVETTLQELLAQHGVPAAGEEIVDPDAYADQAGRHARGETVENRTVHTLRPLGVYPQSYAPEFERYGGRSVMAASEHLFQQSSELVCAAVAHGPSLAARRGIARHLTRAAAMTLGSEIDQAVFYAIGQHSWTAWARSYGFADSTIDAVTDRARAIPRDDTDLPGWAAGWQDQVSGLVNHLEAHGNPIPGAVVSSHVHMTHNRLGLSILDELLSYATLASWHPAPAGSVPDLPFVPA
jgi:Lantibiotic biosynthesis dehydratase C-term